MIYKPYEKGFCNKCYYRMYDKCPAYKQTTGEFLFCCQVGYCDYFLPYEKVADELVEKLKKRKDKNE